MLNPQLSVIAANASADAVLAFLAGGTLDVYGGLQPPSADSPPGGQLLARLRFGTPAFGKADVGEARAFAIDAGLAQATGTATWFRCSTAGGEAVWDGSAGDGDVNLVLTPAEIQEGAAVTVAELVYRQSMGT